MVGTRSPGPHGHHGSHARAHVKPLHRKKHVAHGHAEVGPAGREPKPALQRKQDEPRQSAYSEAEITAANEELKLLVDNFHAPMISAKTGKHEIVYARPRLDMEKYETEKFLQARDGYFGSTAAYLACKEAGILELDANKEKLRGSIDPNKKSRKHLAHWKDAQDVMYAWVRRGYEKALGSDVNVPARIIAQDSDQLKRALKQVSIKSGHEFAKGTFNPRVQKHPDGYRLGTISDHAFGNAIDIDDTHNPQLTETVWAALVKYTGVPGDLAVAASRKEKWNKRPKELYDAISTMNREFTTRIQAATQAQTKAGVTDPDAIRAALHKSDKNLAKIPDKKLKGIMENGILNHTWELVSAMHDAQMLWGATFTTVDLHHFELLDVGETQ